MKYLLTLEIGAYEDYSCKPVAVFDDLGKAQRWAQLDSATVINDLQWETYESSYGVLWAYTGTTIYSEKDRWVIEGMPENPEPGTRLG